MMMDNGHRMDAGQAAWICIASAVSAVLLKGCIALEEKPPKRKFVPVLHQQFHTADPEAWPPEWRSLSQLWREKHPSWQWRFWTDAEEAQLFHDELPEFEALYQHIPKCLDAAISQADLSSYAVLYVHGGVYADLDTLPFGPLDSMLEAAVEAAGRHVALLVNVARPDDEEDVRGLGGFAEPYAVDKDVMMATAPKHPFFYEVLRSIQIYMARHNQTICNRARDTPTFDLMFLTAWGRLSMCARSWSVTGMNSTSLQFLEALFLRDPVDAAYISAVLHLLGNASMEDLLSHPPPKRDAHFEHWLEKATQRQAKRSPEYLEFKHGQLRAMVQGPDLFILPVAASPSSVTKASLRRLRIACTSGSRTDPDCFLQPVREAIEQEFAGREPQQSLLAIFNQDAGVWEGSWSKVQQQAYEDATTRIGEQASASESQEL